LSDKDVHDQFDRADQAVGKATGARPALVRPLCDVLDDTAVLDRTKPGDIVPNECPQWTALDPF
jgi:hypothetical protein